MVTFSYIQKLHNTIDNFLIYGIHTFFGIEELSDSWALDGKNGSAGKQQLASGEYEYRVISNMARLVEREQHLLNHRKSWRWGEDYTNDKLADSQLFKL